MGGAIVIFESGRQRLQRNEQRRGFSTGILRYGGIEEKFTRCRGVQGRPGAAGGGAAAPRPVQSVWLDESRSTGSKVNSETLRRNQKAS
jgi:hypothetical protein